MLLNLYLSDENQNYALYSDLIMRESVTGDEFSFAVRPGFEFHLNHLPVLWLGQVT